MTFSITDLSWAAGAIDGEGCILLQTQKVSSSVRPQYRLSVSIANCDPRMPKKLLDMFGGTLISRQQTFRRRALWEWRIYSTKAVKALEVLRPYMVVKGEQADIAIEFGTTLKRTGGHSPEVLIARAEMKQRMADLKVVQFEEAV